MQLKSMLAGAALIVATASITTQVVSQNEPADGQQDMLDMPVLKPGKYHEKIGYRTGTWNHTYTLWMAPSAPPENMQGSTTTEWTLDGRFLQTSGSYNAMGSDIEEFIFTGYDNFREQYIMMYASSFGTGWSIATGQPQEDGSILWTGTQDMPHMNMKDVKYRIVERKVSDDKATMEFYYENETVEGGWHKQLVIESTKQK